MPKTKDKKPVAKMNAPKKQTSIPEKNRSYVSKDGHAHFKHTGGYYEVTTAAKGIIQGTSIGD